MKSVFNLSSPPSFSEWQVLSSSPNPTEPSIPKPSQDFKCNQCLKNFSSKHCLKEHSFTHTNERPYSCNRCNKQFKHASQLSVHKKVHILKTEVKWPTLTQLLKFEKRKTYNCEFLEVIRLPPLGVAQELSLPLHKALENERN